MKKVLFPVLALVLAVALALPIAVAPAAVAQTDEDRTPFQQSIIETIAQREAQGLPVPSDVSFEYKYDSDTKITALLEGGIMPGDQFTITAKTVIHFDNPEQAGNEQWPDLVVEGDMPSEGEGFIKEGNYSQFIKDKVEEENPGFWEEYEFGYEPRTYTFNEKYTVTYPELNAGAMALTAEALSTSTYQDGILMGFTFPGPGLDYEIPWSFDIAGVTVINFWAGFQLDWILGVRLPMEVSLTSTDPMTEGSTYYPTSKARGLNWSGQDFEQAGVAPEDGNEFVMHFVFACGVFLEVFGVDVINLGVDYNLDESSSFTTPFGPGATFDLPSLDIPIWDLDVGVAYAKIGFELTPDVGSTNFTADWLASGEASGSGNLTYTDPNFPVQLGPVNAIDGPGHANIKLDAFRYYFNKFLLDLSLYLYLDVFDVWAGTFTAPITDFDLSAITGNLYVGVHSSSTPDAFNVSIDIQNVLPTAEIDRTGTLLINDVPTFMAHAGDPLDFYGHATDPGRDDLTLSWDWDDGEPSPDVTTSYTVPHDVTEKQTHAFGDACLYNISFMAVDDDGGHGEDNVAVIITGGADNRARLEGYWQHQYSGKGKIDFDQATLEGYLAIVGYMSTVFNEARDAPTIEQAHDVIFLKQNDGSAIEQLDRELLVVWLNFANGAIGYMELVDTDKDGIGDTLFADVVAVAEGVRLNSDATKVEIKEQTNILHHILEMGK